MFRNYQIHNHLDNPNGFAHQHFSVSISVASSHFAKRIQGTTSWKIFNLHLLTQCQVENGGNYSHNKNKTRQKYPNYLYTIGEVILVVLDSNNYNYYLFNIPLESPPSKIKQTKKQALPSILQL